MDRKCIEKYKTKKQIAEDLNIDVKTLTNKLRKEGTIIPRGLVSPKIQLEIYQLLGFSTP